MKKLRILLGVIVALTLVVALAYGQQVKRLYFTMTLFDEDVIVHNFSNMASMFPTDEVAPSSEASQFERQDKALPTTYSYKVDTVQVEEFLDRTSTTALMVVKGNTVTFENYYQGTTETDYRISWSTAKSYLSALFGIAVDEGHIKSIEEPVTAYVPSLKGSGYDGVRIKDVLQMSSGVRFDEDYMDFDSDINRFGREFALGGSFDEFAASLVSERSPGSYLHYVSIDTHVLGMVIRAATGRHFVDYFQEKIWSKIEPEASVLYVVDNNNEPMVLGGMNMRTRDFMRFGQLYLNNGNWKGQQVVPAEWVKQSVTPDSPHLMPGKRDNSSTTRGYGYQWWVPQNADQEFVAAGIYGQYIYVNQKAGVVIVKNSADLNFADNNFESFDESVAVFRAITASL